MNKQTGKHNKTGKHKKDEVLIMNLFKRTYRKGQKKFVTAAAVTVAALNILAPIGAYATAYNTSAYAASYNTGAYIAAGQPSAADTAEINIYGVGEGAAVRAYHIVEATYNDYGLTGYRQLDAAAAVSKITKNTDAKGTVLYDDPTYENISALTQAIQADTGGIQNKLEAITLTWDAEKEAYVTEEAKAGSYLVLVEHETEGYVYNPMYVSNSYTDANTKDSLGKDTDNNGHANGSVTAEPDKVIQLAGADAYAKKSQTFLTKDIVNPSTGNTKADDERIGDSVTFDVKTITPDYSDGFMTSDITFTVTDFQSDGLAVVDPADIYVYTGDAETGTLLGTEYYKKSVDTADNTWTVDFSAEWVKENPNTKLTIRYSTVIDEDAVMANESNPNIAQLEYTTVYKETEIIKDKTRHYTFEVHAVKTDADGNALAGAVFELTQLSEGNISGAGTLPEDSVVYTAESDENGRLDFTGLEEGTYTLREIKAPKGYTLNDSTWTVTITPAYDAVENIISRYTVSITENYADGSTSETRSSSYTVAEHKDSEDGLSDTVVLTESYTEDEPIVSISDTRLSKLPSVGGAGTLVLTAGGVMIVGAALVLTLHAKKKDKPQTETKA